MSNPKHTAADKISQRDVDILNDFAASKSGGRIDTNQASEDELNDKLYDLAVQNVQDTETGEQFYALAPKDVIELIRTEKLKLLAELDALPEA